MASPGSDRLLGREMEIAALDRELDASRESGRLVLCTGEPGIGKTRLAQESAGRALVAGVTVVWGRAFAAEDAPPLWPWQQVLRGLQAPDHLAAGQVDRASAFSVVADAVIALARDRLVVVLDDVHWFDEASLILVRHLAKRAHEAPLLMLVLAREAELRARLPDVMADLERTASSSLRLSSLGFLAVKGMLAGADERTVRAVVESTGGNPLFVQEIARAIREHDWRPDRTPPSIQHSVSARLRRLTPVTLRLVQTAAIAGHETRPDLLATALGTTPADLDSAVEEAIAHGLLVHFPGHAEVRFRHAVIRDAVEATLSVGEFGSAHRALAHAICQVWADDLDDHLADIARHWLALAPYGERDTARTWAIRAGDDALRRLGYESGLRWYRAALDLDAPWPDPALAITTELAAARAAYLAGQIEAAVGSVSAAAEAARRAGRADLLAASALALEPASHPGVNSLLGVLTEEALRHLDVGAAVPRARLLALRSRLAFYSGRDADAETASREALHLAIESGDSRALTAALRARKDACPGPASAGERLTLADRLQEVASRQADATNAMWARLWRFEGLVDSGDVTGAVHELGPLAQATGRLGGPAARWHHAVAAACAAQAAGRFAEARHWSQLGFDIMRPIEPAAALGAYFGAQCAIARHAGTGTAALSLARSAASPPPQFESMSRVARACLLLGAGRPGEAATHLALARGQWSWPAFFVIPGFTLALQAAVGLGLLDETRRALDALQPHRGLHSAGGGVVYLGPVELSTGIGALALGAADAAITDLDAAARIAERAGAPGFAAEARFHLVRALRLRAGTGDRERARAVWEDCSRVAGALGMAALAAGIVDLGRVLQQPRSLLTAREQQVSRLVAEGLTNRQIAGSLVLSERTVGNHIQRIFTKLGLGTRSQLTRWVTQNLE